MPIRVKLSTRMAGDHGTHPEGKIVTLPDQVAAQIVANRHGVALDPIPESLAEVEPTAFPPLVSHDPAPILPPREHPTEAEVEAARQAIGPEDTEALEGWGADPASDPASHKGKKAKK